MPSSYPWSVCLFLVWESQSDWSWVGCYMFYALKTNLDLGKERLHLKVLLQEETGPVSVGGE